MDQSGTSTVRHRRVFYIPGYDPFPPRRYRELYRKHSARQGGISGYDIAIQPRHAPGAYGWQVDALIDGAQVHSDMTVLAWSDLVQDSMKTGVLATYGQLLRTAWIYVRSGALRPLSWLRKGPILAVLYPVGMLILQFLLAFSTFWLVSVAVADGLHRLVELFTGPRIFGPFFALRQWLALGAGLAAGAGLLAWFRRQDRRVMAYYLMHDFAYSASQWGQYPANLEQRLQQFKQTISDALLDPTVDEVLVVGHSSGAHLAVSVLADLLRESDDAKPRAKLALLSLGQVVPMVSFLPKAWRLRADLQYLSQSDALCWVDVSAPGDGCSFALCDPVAVSGVATAQKRWPLVVSAAFSQTLSPPEWGRLKRRYFRLHFQYLCAFDQPGHYDYFQITAGPQTLADRYAGKAPSKSRIDVAASPHRGTQP